MAGAAQVHGGRALLSALCLPCGDTVTPQPGPSLRKAVTFYGIFFKVFSDHKAESSDRVFTQDTSLGKLLAGHETCFLPPPYLGVTWPHVGRKLGRGPRAVGRTGSLVSWVLRPLSPGEGGQ